MPPTEGRSWRREWRAELAGAGFGQVRFRKLQTVRLEIAQWQGPRVRDCKVPIGYVVSVRAEKAEIEGVVFIHV